MIHSLVPRSDFAATAEHCYLNQAALGLSPLIATQAQARFEELHGGLGNIGFSDEDEAEAHDSLREVASRLFGVREAEVAVTSGASEALNQIAWWLSPGSDANVVSVATDFPSVTYPWLRISRSTGCEIRLVSDDARIESLTDTIIDAIDERTKAVSVSMVQYATGRRVDAARIASAVQAVGGVLILDVTQAAGAIPVSLQALGADALVTSGYKWLCGSGGIGLCCLAPRFMESFDPPFVGWRGTPDPFAFDATVIRAADDARRLELSTTAYAAAAALEAAIGYLLAVDLGRVDDHARALADYLLEKVAGTDVVALGVPGGSHQSSHLLALTVPGSDVRILAAELAKRGVFCGARLDRLRLSLHLYNDAADVDRFLGELADVRGTARTGVESF